MFLFFQMFFLGDELMQIKTLFSYSTFIIIIFYCHV